MAISSPLSSSTLFRLHNSTSISSKPKIIPTSFSFSKQQQQQMLMQQQQPYKQLSTTRVFAAPEPLDSEQFLLSSLQKRMSYLQTSKFLDSDSYLQTSKLLDSEDSEVSEFDIGSPRIDDSNTTTEVLGLELSDWDQLSQKLIIRVKLKSFYVNLIEEAAKKILDAGKITNAIVKGPVPLPTKKRVYCVLKSPHVHKDARCHIEIRTHSRLIDILYPTAGTIDALMLIKFPPAVDIKLTF